MKNFYWLTAVPLLGSNQLSAHDTYLEKEEEKTYLYFNEFAHNKIEVKRKKLDNMQDDDQECCQKDR